MQEQVPPRKRLYVHADAHVIHGALDAFVKVNFKLGRYNSHCRQLRVLLLVNWSPCCYLNVYIINYSCTILVYTQLFPNCSGMIPEQHFLLNFPKLFLHNSHGHKPTYHHALSSRRDPFIQYLKMYPIYFREYLVKPFLAQLMRFFSVFENHYTITTYSFLIS